MGNDALFPRGDLPPISRERIVKLMRDHGRLSLEAAVVLLQDVIGAPSKDRVFDYFPRLKDLPSDTLVKLHASRSDTFEIQIRSPGSLNFQNLYVYDIDRGITASVPESSERAVRETREMAARIIPDTTGAVVSPPPAELALPPYTLKTTDQRSVNVIQVDSATIALQLEEGNTVNLTYDNASRLAAPGTRLTAEALYMGDLAKHYHDLGWSITLDGSQGPLTFRGYLGKDGRSCTLVVTDGKEAQRRGKTRIDLDINMLLQILS